MKRLKLLTEHKGVQTFNYDEARIVLEEIERLNNIINELEKFINSEVDYIEWVVDPILDKLQELKKESE